MKHEIVTDGITVWVNSGEDGSSIARFGRQGIDIHRSAKEQRTLGPCLFCTHAPTTPADWKLFQEKMLELYYLRIDDKFKPKRFRTSAGVRRGGPNNQ